MFKIPLFGLSSVFYTSCTKKEPYLFIGKTHKFKNCLNLMTLDIPVLLLSALNEVDDKVQGFDLGANDYLSKPFSTKELIARIKVMLKENIVDDSYLQYQDILLNKKEETLSCKNIKYQLSKYECSILSLLIRSELNRVPVWLVIEKVWQNMVDVDVKTVSLYISYVNRKLKALDSKAYIKFDEENIELCVNI